MHSLAVYQHRRQIFHADGPWLYPLLELESWLETNRIDTSKVELYDKIVGRAGAMLICRLGFLTVRTDLISNFGVDVFDRHGVQWTSAARTERILCATESLLENETDLEAAHQLIQDRANQQRKSAETPLLSIRDLNVLVGGRHILSRCDLDIRAGEKVLVTGENGTGKTTLLRTILGLHPASGGRILFRGAAVGSRQWKRLRSDMAYVRQEEVQNRFVISAGEVATIGARVANGLAITGVDHLEHRPFHELSGGERRRVSLARAFAQQPSLIVLDEPTAGLDRAARASLLQAIEEGARDQGTAVLMVSHQHTDADFDGWRRYALASGSLHEA